MAAAFDSLADTPAEAAYHLVASRGCCDPQSSSTASPNPTLVAELNSLQRQKSALEGELEAISGRLCSLPTLLQLGTEIKFLNNLVMQLEQQNQSAKAVGLANLQTLSGEYFRVEQERENLTARNVEVTSVYRQEMEINHGLKMEVEGLMQRIRLLHQRNNELVRLFQ